MSEFSENFRSIYPRTAKNEKVIRERVYKIINDKIMITKLNRLQPPSSGAKKTKKRKKSRKLKRL